MYFYLHKDTFSHVGIFASNELKFHMRINGKRDCQILQGLTPEQAYDPSAHVKKIMDEADGLLGMDFDKFTSLLVDNGELPKGVNVVQLIYVDDAHKIVKEQPEVREIDKWMKSQADLQRDYDSSMGCYGVLTTNRKVQREFVLYTCIPKYKDLDPIMMVCPFIDSGWIKDQYDPMIASLFNAVCRAAEVFSRGELCKVAELPRTTDCIPV